jgi:hypothetical protein
VLAAAILSAALVSTACGETREVRRRPPQQQVMARIYTTSAIAAGAKILDAFDWSRSALPEPCRQMTANALTPPRFSPDWLVALVDSGGFLCLAHVDLA